MPYTSETDITAKGMPVEQAEILSGSQTRLYKRLATKEDLAQLEAHLRKDTDDKLEKLELRMDIKFESVNAKFDAKFESINTRFESINTRFESINTRFESVNTKIEKMANRLILALGAIVVGAATILGIFFKVFPPVAPMPAQPTPIIIQAANPEKANDLKKALEGATFYQSSPTQANQGYKGEVSIQSLPAHKQ